VTLPRLAVVGCANRDVTIRVKDLPRTGETLLGEDLQESMGGKGANQAAAAARLGMATTFFGMVGRDSAGERVVRNLTAHGVDVRCVREGNGPTGTALITVDSHGENTIVVAPGVNDELDCRAQSFDDFDVVLGQLEVSARTMLDVARRSRCFLLNAAPPTKVHRDLLDASEVVIVNETELLGLTLSEISRCVVTLGAQGAEYYEFGERRDVARPPVVQPVDTVGAGDVFCAAFATQFAHGRDMSEILKYAVTAGALATLAVGAQGALPLDSEVREWLARAS